MTDVFGFAAAAEGEFLRDAAVDAGYELRLFDGERTLDQIADANGIGTGRWRLAALLDVLVALGALARRSGARAVADRADRDVFVRAQPPPRPAESSRAGWGAMVDGVRRDRPPHPAAGVELRH